MKQKFYVSWLKYEWEDHPTPTFWEIDVSKTTGHLNHIWLGQTVEIDLPEPPSDFEFTAAKVRDLKKQMGEHQNAITELQRKINELLAIEHKDSDK